MAVAVFVAVAVAVGVALAVAVGVAVAVAVGVAVAVAVGVAVAVAVGVALAVAVGDGGAVPVAVGSAVGEGDWVAVGVGIAVGTIVTVGEGEGDAVGVAGGLCDGVPARFSVTSGVGVAVEVGSAAAVGDVGVAVAVGDGLGCGSSAGVANGEGVRLGVFVTAKRVDVRVGIRGGTVAEAAGDADTTEGDGSVDPSTGAAAAAIGSTPESERSGGDCPHAPAPTHVIANKSKKRRRQWRRAASNGRWLSHSAMGHRVPVPTRDCAGGLYPIALLTWPMRGWQWAHAAHCQCRALKDAVTICREISELSPRPLPSPTCARVWTETQEGDER